MTDQSGIKKTVVGAVLAGALSLTSLFGGIASADTPSISEVVVTKVADSASPDFNGDGDVDGSDFLVWQRASSAIPGGVDASDLAVWQEQYGTSPSSSTGGALDPEYKYVSVRR